MRSTLILLMIFLLAWLLSGNGQTADVGTDNVVVELFRAMAAVFRWYAVLSHVVEVRLWEAMSGEFLVLLGGLKCLNLLLALWGTFCLWVLWRVFSRTL